MVFKRLHTARGFTIIEVVIAIAIFATLAAMTLKYSSSDVLNSSGVGALEATRSADQQTNSIYNLINQFSVYSAYASLPTTAGGTVRVPASNRTAYSSNGETVYYTIDVVNNEYRTNTSGNLVNLSGATVAAGSAVLTAPNGADVYKATLNLYKLATGGTAYATIPFMITKNPCDSAVATYCPTQGTSATTLETFLEAYYPMTF